MSTSVDRPIKKRLVFYGAWSLVLIVFTVVYEQFSYGVISNYMRLSFLLPLIGGLLTLLAERVCPPKTRVISLWHMTLWAFIGYLLLTGIFEIYGTVQDSVMIFLILGIIMALITTIHYIYDIVKGNTI